MTFALPSILEGILNPEFKKSGKNRLCQAPARYEIRQSEHKNYTTVMTRKQWMPKLKRQNQG